MKGSGWVEHRSDADDVDRDAERSALRDLKAVHVVVETLPADAIRNGLTESEIEGHLHSALRRIGLTALPRSRDSEAMGQPLLYVAVKIGVVQDGPPPGRFVTFTSLDLKQDVRLLPPRSALSRATTWSTGSTGVAVGREIGDVCRRGITRGIQQFVDAYTAANPPRTVPA